MASLITFEDKTPVSIKIGTFNVANALNDEKSEMNNFFKREKQVVETIRRIKPHVMALLELRPYQNRITGEMCYPPDFLGKLSEYAHKYQYNSANSLAFANGILYDRSVLFPIREVTHWLSETPDFVSDSWGNGFGRTMFGVKFHHVLDGKVNKHKCIWIYVTHLGLREEEKEHSVKLIPKLIREDTGGDPFVVMGDFNFFDDRDGKKQRQLMVSADLVDVGVETYFSFDETKRCYGTFMGFETDHVKFSYEDLSDPSKASRLDHIFTSKDIKTTRVVVYADCEEQLMTKTTPSDHLPLIAELEF